jgi:hypothetical protein
VDGRASHGRRIAVLVARDLLVVALTAGLVIADHLRNQFQNPSVVLGVVTGFMITVSGFYAHEWGHYLAARWAGASPVPSPSPISVYLFELEEDACTRRQWLTMSLGGYLATIVALPIILAIIDVHALSGQVALVLTGLGVLATFGLELPITYRVYRKPAAD